MGVKAATSEREHETKGDGRICRQAEGEGEGEGEGAHGRDQGESEILEERRDQGDGEGEKIQDVLVPWVLRSKPKPKPKPKSKPQLKSQSLSKPDSSQVTSQSSTNPDEASEATDEKQEGGEQGGENEKNGMEEEEEEEEEKEKVFNRYYHLFTEGELRDLIYEAGKEEGYRILPSIPSSTIKAMTDKMTTTTALESSRSVDAEEKFKWLRIRGEGWEADNWWVEAEVGVGDGH